MDFNFHKENELLRSSTDQLANNPKDQIGAKGLTDEANDSDDCGCNACNFSNPDGECRVGGKCRCDGRILHQN